ncbi:MAG TPA: L,D-transpeptidase family protein [Caulobacteraceae bacterium]|nr:L,D-transpeptidase family protein [Caulobacteraceae bacterium]
MNFIAWSDGRFELPGRTVPCALGPAGVVDAAAKREGDGATPLGVWPILRVRFRPDRLEAPKTALPVSPLKPSDGWCDDPKDGAYNRPVTLPYGASCEAMWREDELYDVVVILAHNDDPPVPGLGSAIFLHCAKPGYPATQGCVALAREDLLELLGLAAPGDAIEVRRA